MDEQNPIDEQLDVLAGAKMFYQARFDQLVRKYERRGLTAAESAELDEISLRLDQIGRDLDLFIKRHS